MSDGGDSYMLSKIPAHCALHTLSIIYTMVCEHKFLHIVTTHHSTLRQHIKVNLASEITHTWTCARQTHIYRKQQINIYMEA